MGWLDRWRARSDARTERQRHGDVAEDAALAHLRAGGLKLLERNFRCRGGEIDLIMQDGPSLVFVEVRSRSQGSYGGALASITLAKQRRLRLAASYFLQRHGQTPPCRFDVVVFEAGQLQWLRDAIQA